MPVNKRISKDKTSGAVEAIVPPKEQASKNKKPLQFTPTAQTDKPRINALATSGKKKRPK